MRMVIFIILAIPVILYGQNTDSAWIKSNYTKIEKLIPMRDGIKLFTSIYLPKDINEKHPILITRTPYSCSPYGEQNFRPFWTTHYKEYFKENYIMVIQDVRGRYMSEGTFEDIRPFNPAKNLSTETDEASDTYDTIEWLVKNLENNNGKAGVFGISYPGFYSTMAALSNHPALKAVSPQAPVTDWFAGDDFHHNGAFMLMDAFDFYSGFGRPRPYPTQHHGGGIKYTTKDAYSFYLQHPTFNSLSKKYMGDSIKFWNDLKTHPDYDGWWQARTVTNYLYKIQPAILVVGGLFDAEDCFGAWKTYKTIENQSPNSDNRLVMGPWYHGGWVRSKGSHLGRVQFNSETSTWYQNNIEIPFFNFFLKGKGSINQIMDANIFFTGENTWKQFNQWPPAKIKKRDLFLNHNGKLDWALADGKLQTSKFSSFVCDPSKPVPYTENITFDRTREYMTDDQRFASRRPDVLAFSTDTLTEDITLAGSITADIMISTTGTDADIVVKLIDVFPDYFAYSDTDSYIMNGYEMLVRGEVMRAKYRNSFSLPEPLIPNEITRISFKLPDIAHTFKRGHKIMVQVQGSWFPLVDRNPNKFINIYDATPEDYQKAEIKLFHSSEASSKIVIPVLQ